MRHESEHYVNGMWVAPLEFNFIDVVDPATEDVFARVALGGAKDVDRAVAAAKAAFPAFSRTTREQRLDLLKNIVSEYESRRREIAGVLCQEMGAPISIALDGMTSPIDLVSMIEVLEGYQFEEIIGGTKVVREAIGVAGLITPWNWPIDQIMMKVAPALAAGCTMVLKPSEEAPLNAVIWSEIMHSAGVPEGVFNMLQGSGPVVGEAMSGHPDIAIMSFTGSTRAGISVARTAALTVKRVSQELGGKSADILLPDADFGIAVEKGVRRAMLNSGQTCSAPSRMLVPADRHEEVIGLARRVIQGTWWGRGTIPELIWAR
jgi:aldehyde dehydrogenase (NAD+)